MEYEGKGNRNNHFEKRDYDKKVYNKSFYALCIPCNYNGQKNEIICSKCGKLMHQKSTMGRIDKKGNIKF